MINTTTYSNDILRETCSVSVHSSGLKIYVVEKPDYKSAYAVFGTKYGSIDNCFTLNGNEEKVPEGIAHFLEHKLFECEDGDAFTKFAKTGAYANAYTSFDKTCYLFSCSERFFENLDILLDFVQNPYFTSETVKKEQGIIGQEIRMYDDSPSWRVMFNMLEAMFYNNPVKVDIAGTVESIAKITDEYLYKCYNAFYDPSNMFICIAGNVDTEEVLKRIDQRIKKTSRPEVVCPKIQEPDEIVKPIVRQSFEVSMPMFCLAFKESGNGDRTLKEELCSGMMLELLGGETSKLFEILQNEELINDEFSVEYFSGRGFAVPMFSGESMQPEKVRDIIFDEINRIIVEGIDEEHFNAVKKAAYGSVVRKFNSTEAIASSLVECAVNGDGIFDDFEMIMNIEKEDIMERLKLLKSEKAVLSVIDPKE